MDQKWIQILVILMFCQKMTSGADPTVRVLKEEQSTDIECQTPATTNTIIWFRALDNSGMEFISSFSPSGLSKLQRTDFSKIFSQGSKSKHTLKSFNKTRDSGIYSCATLIGSELKFGQVTRLVGEEVKKVPTAAPPTKPPNNQIATACDCNKTKKPAGAAAAASPPLLCSTLILAPLAGGCGLLLLLLIITTVYCNRIRTRRCPHHYKRKPRVAPEKQMMANRHV